MASPIRLKTAPGGCCAALVRDWSNLRGLRVLCLNPRPDSCLGLLRCFGLTHSGTLEQVYMGLNFETGEMMAVKLVDLGQQLGAEVSREFDRRWYHDVHRTWGTGNLFTRSSCNRTDCVVNIDIYFTS